MRRSGFKRKLPAGHATGQERVRSIPKPVPGAFRLPSAVVEQAQALPKQEKLRNATLLGMARGEPCMLQVPGVCNRDSATSVQCHSNLGMHGKGKGTKAHDCFSFSGCSACHFWLDQDKHPSYEEKQAATMLALERQVQRWMQWLHAPLQFGMRKRMVAAWAALSLLSIAEKTPHVIAAATLSALQNIDKELLQ